MKKSTGNLTKGIVLVNKEKGLSSHDCVNKMRKLLFTKKVGHAGTLDPNARGLLVIAFGQATKLLEYLTNDIKAYEAELQLGIRTDTLDITGLVTEKSTNIPDICDIKKAEAAFTGKIKQLPPMYSAIKIGGKRLYDLARNGMVVDRVERDIELYNLKLYDYDYPNLKLSCTCSKGSYIRSLIDDIGVYLKSFATMTELNRVKSGNFSLENAYCIDEIKEKVMKNDYSFVIPVEEALSLEKFDLAPERFDKVINGLSSNTTLSVDDKKYMLYCKDELIGIGSVKEGGKYNQMTIEKLLYKKEEHV